MPPVKTGAAYASRIPSLIPLLLCPLAPAARPASAGLHPLLPLHPLDCIHTAPLSILAKYRGRARRWFSFDFTEPTPFSIYISYSTIKTADIAVFTSSHTSPASPALYILPLSLCHCIPCSLHLHSIPCSSRAPSSCDGTMLLYVPRRRQTITPSHSNNIVPYTPPLDV